MNTITIGDSKKLLASAAQSLQCSAYQPASAGILAGTSRFEHRADRDAGSPKVSRAGLCRFALVLSSAFLALIPGRGLSQPIVPFKLESAGWYIQVGMMVNPSNGPHVFANPPAGPGLWCTPAELLLNGTTSVQARDYPLCPDPAGVLQRTRHDSAPHSSDVVPSTPWAFDITCPLPQTGPFGVETRVAGSRSHPGAGHTDLYTAVVGAFLGTVPGPSLAPRFVIIHGSMGRHTTTPPPPGPSPMLGGACLQPPSRQPSFPNQDYPVGEMLTSVDPETGRLLLLLVVEGVGQSSLGNVYVRHDATGPVLMDLRPLMQTRRTDTNCLALTIPDVAIPMSVAQVLMSGNAYIEALTTAHPDGKLVGTLVPVPNQSQTGYYNLPLQPGWNVVANQLSRGNNTLADVLPSVPPGSSFYRWDVNSQSYSVSVFDPDFGGWDFPSLPLGPGEGGFLHNPGTPFTVTFVGETVTPHLPLNLPYDQPALVARQIPAPATYEEIVGLPPAEGTKLYRYDSALQGEPFNFSNWVGYTFSQGLWTPATPNVSVGEPVFIQVPSPDGPPTIVAQPSSQRANVAGTAEFRVEANSSSPLTFQWRKDGVDLQGQTSPMLNLPNVQPGDAGQYDVVVRNSAGPVTSAAALLTVNTAPILPLVPDQFVHAGAELRVPITATDADSPATNLVYSLAFGAPPNVSIDPHTGELSVVPTATENGLSFNLTVLVQDDGQPPLVDSKTFTVIVAPPLKILSFDRGEDGHTVTWASIPGTAYQVWCKRNLQDSWEEVFGPVVATGHTASKTDYAIHGEEHKYYTVTTTTSTPRVPTTTTTPPNTNSWQYCLLAPDLRPGKQIKVDIIAPAADITSKRAETIPLVVKGEDEDQMIQQCICIKPEGVFVSARDFNVPDGVQYKWSIEDVDWSPKATPLPPPFSGPAEPSKRDVIAALNAAKLLPNLEGPATLLRSSILNLEVGQSFTITVKVEVRDVLGNDPRPYVLFKIKVSRTADCTYTHEITKTKVEHGDKTVTLTPSQCDCQPQPETWLVPPPLTGDKGTVITESGCPTITIGDAPVTVCAGERVLLTAFGDDKDVVHYLCLGPCGLSVGATPFPDELKYTWTGPAGSFPDYGGATAETNGRKTRAVWKAPDTPGEYTVELIIDDRGGHANDTALPKKIIKLRVIKVKLTIDGVADDEKFCKGRLVCVNSDDDDDNGVNDKDHHPVSSENELVKIVLSKDPPTGAMFLTFNSLYAEEVRVWDSPTKDHQITDNPASFPATSAKELWVEGVNPSRRLRDIELLLESECCQDKGKLTSGEADLDIVKTDDSELAEDKELDSGGYVPVNNDDDDYDGTVDKSDADGVTGESDFVKLTLHKIQPADLKGKYRLVWTSAKVKIWQKAERKDEVTSDSTEFDATTDTTVYVEGLDKSGGVHEEKIYLKWIGDATFPEADEVKFTVYEVTGPLNVPGYSIHTYKGDIPGGGTGSWTADDGTIKSGESANTCTILWNEGPVVGKANFTPIAGFTCKREVNVVQVKLKAGASNALTFKNSPTQNGVGSAQIISHSPGAAMDAKITVEKIVGPTVGGQVRGVKYMEIGFIQNGQLTREHGNFDGFAPKQRRVASLQDGANHIDYITGASASTAPWYDTQDVTGTDGFLAPGADADITTDQNFNVSDTPRITATDTMSLTIGAVTDAVDSFGLEFDFELYFAVRTTEAVNNSEKVFTQRGKATWEFDGSGTVDATSTWTQTGGGNTGSASFTEVTDGTVVPITTGTPINNLFAGRTWATVNQ